ncbi:MAG: 4-hydroxy-3-methylbut-2-enyl diphosphate reductase [Bacteroidetes bacterium]|nr:4-hydroxy-3-methylbut-2-enyl diphosphate reductase [Bacteroidota bacterium]
MPRTFDIPQFYRSPIISTLKTARMAADPRKKDLTPSLLDFGPVHVWIARNFGFCFGVENAVEIAYRAISDHPDRRLFMLSEMIHNPQVNNDLRRRGMQFLRSSMGDQLIDFKSLAPEDIVVIPAFGTTLEIKEELKELGVDVRTYDTTCPFVKKVWRRSEKIGGDGYTVIIHGKRLHEESRASFSHANEHAPVLVIRDVDDAEDLAQVIRGEKDRHYFYERFAECYSEGFDPDQDLARIGVVNQTTMLVTETQEVTDVLRKATVERYGEEGHFVDTSDTLCYATHENQEAARAMLEKPLDLALVVGGYNSSNTSQIVSLYNEVIPTYFIRGSEEIEDRHRIHHYDYPAMQVRTTVDWIPSRRPVSVAITSGASCPDMLVDDVIRKVVAFFEGVTTFEEALAPYQNVSEELLD